MSFLNLASLLGTAAADPNSPLATPNVQGLLGPMPSYVQSGLLAGGPQGDQPQPQQQAAPAPQPQADPSQQPIAPPQWGHRGFLGDLLDNAFLGGSIQDTRKEEYARQMQDYQQRVMQQQLAALPPDQRAAFLTNPSEYGKALAGKLFTPVTLGADQREAVNGNTVNGAQGTVTVDQPSGTMFNNLTGATGPTLGGDIDPVTGVSKRTGVQVPVATVQTVGPGQHAGYTMPPIGMPPMAASGAPGGAPTIAAPVASPTATAPVLPAFPAPADILRALPGAQITSAARTPGHNVAVGGVPNSYHLTGQAVDLVPPAGVPMPQFASAVSQAFPNLHLINEGTHVHLQPALGTPRGGVSAPVAAPAGAGVPSSLTGGQVGAPQPMPGLPGMWQVQPDGTMKHLDGTGLTSDDALKMGKSVMDDKSYEAAKESGAAFQAMLGLAAQKPGGMRAYALRDTFARTINPGAVARAGTIEAIKQSQGVPAQVQAYLLNLKGDGDVPPQIVQQILSAAAPFAQAHWDDANSLNQHFAGIAKRNGLDPDMATAPLGPRPAIPTPAPQAGAVVTGRGGVQYRFKGGNVRDKANWIPVAGATR